MTVRPRKSPAAPPTSDKKEKSGYTDSSFSKMCEFSASFHAMDECFVSEYVCRVVQNRLLTISSVQKLSNKKWLNAPSRDSDPPNIG